MTSSSTKRSRVSSLKKKSGCSHNCLQNSRSARYASSCRDCIKVSSPPRSNDPPATRIGYQNSLCWTIPERTLALVYLGEQVSSVSTHHPHYQLLTKLLREVREQRGLSQVELAERLGNTQTFVSKVERGERRLDVVELIEFCEAMEVPVDQWLKDYLKRRATEVKRHPAKRKTAQ
ncbi:MAG: helix-turn-helix domain-containing protein [Rhodanobacter sp.]